MRKWIVKKEKGFSELLGTSLCMLVLLIILISSVHFLKLLECKRVLNDFGREYLLVLETNGALTEDEIADLKNRIHGLSCENGKFQEVTVTFNENNKPVEYGQEVYLSILVKASWKELGLSKVYDYIQDSYTFNINLYSTSKA